MSGSTSPPEDVLGLDAGLDALQQSSEFRGPVEPLDGEHCNDHFALLYEEPEEQYAAAIPFLRQGIERDERCIYVVADEESQAEVLAALRASDVDVGAAIERDQFAFEYVADTYLRNDVFEPDEMVDFYEGVVNEATEEWSALRIVAETSWLQEEDTSMRAFMEYESKVNRLFDDEDVIALCQYDRDAFEPDVVRDIVETHPHLIYDGTVCHNFYHTPPREFFGPDQPEREVDRMLGTLTDRTETKAELEERQSWLHEQNEIVSSPELSFEEKLQALFDLGCERLDVDLGAMARVAPQVDEFGIEYTSGDHEHFRPGLTLPLSETFCTAAVEANRVTSVTDPVEEGYGEITVFERFGFETYVGLHLHVDGSEDRTFFFVGSDPHPDGFSSDERTFLQMMGQWVTYELEQHHRERRLERTVDRLERSNERLEQFAHAASHDLQEPLRMVSSYLQLVESRSDDELTEDTREYLEFAVDGADRMRDMIDGLLQYSRVETRGDPLEPVDLDVVLGEVLDDLRLQLRETSATIDSEGLPTVEGDRDQLRQVFQNLLSNAVEYAGDHPHVEVSAERVGGDWVVSVADDGPGIDPDATDRIFQVFERLHGREEHDGTGIGLALCERVVERHGGEIWVDSEPGEGATFRFTLAAANGRAEADRGQATADD